MSSGKSIYQLADGEANNYGGDPVDPAPELGDAQPVAEVPDLRPSEALGGHG